jgi:hypothetical protein
VNCILIYGRSQFSLQAKSAALRFAYKFSHDEVKYIYTAEPVDRWQTLLNPSLHDKQHTWLVTPGIRTVRSTVLLVSCYVSVTYKYSSSWRMPSSGVWRRVDVVDWTDVSEDTIASIFRVVSSAATCSRWFFARGFFYPEDGGDSILRNVGSIDHIYTAPHPRRRHSS